MSLSKTLDDLSKSSRKISNYCAYQTLYDNLNPEDKKALDNAWVKNIPVSIVVRALRQEGHKTSSDSVRAHRRGECKCLKK